MLLVVMKRWIKSDFFLFIFLFDFNNLLTWIYAFRNLGFQIFYQRLHWMLWNLRMMDRILVMKSMKNLLYFQMIINRKSQGWRVMKGQHFKVIWVEGGGWWLEVPIVVMLILIILEATLQLHIFRIFAINYELNRFKKGPLKGQEKYNFG